MEEQNNKWVLELGVVLGLMLLVSLFFRPIFYLVLILAGIVIFLGGLFFIYKKVFEKKPSPDETPEVISYIKEQKLSCETELANHQQEVIEIKKNIRDLEKSLDGLTDLMVGNRVESKRILSGFYRELELRKTKVDFYDTCSDKLNTLLRNHIYAEDLLKKQAKLQELQADHYEDLATMETLKLELVYHQGYLKSIDELSSKMQVSNSLDTAQSLQTELTKITKELRAL